MTTFRTLHSTRLLALCATAFFGLPALAQAPAAPAPAPATAPAAAPAPAKTDAAAPAPNKDVETQPAEAQKDGKKKGRAGPSREGAPKEGPKEPAAELPPGPVAVFTWLAGCWRGEVNKREFREHWLPRAGPTMVGVSQMASGGRTLDYNYLRLEPRGNDLYYVSTTPGKPEVSFKFSAQGKDVDDELFAFENPASEFPRKITYRRTPSGWLYAIVDGKVNGKDRQVTYPMRRVDCETGEFIRK